MEDNNLNSVDKKEEKIVNKSKISPLLIIFIFFCVLYIVTIFISFNIIKNTKKTAVKIASISTEIGIKKESNKVGVIPIYGAIYKRDYGITEKGSDLIVNMIKKFGEDKNIKAIVLDINSPGGSVGAVQEIYSMIMKVKEQYRKPIVAHFGDVAASGAFYIAMACDKIVSNSGTITGSIGVIFSIPQGDELLKKIGLKTNTIKSGKHKDIGSFSREMTKEERALLQEMIDITYNTFVDVVAKGRKMDREKLKNIADGRIFTGKQAYELGLVDRIGDLYDAIDEAGVMAGIGRNPSVVRARISLFESFLEVLDSKLSFMIPAFSKEYPLLEYRYSF